MYVWRNSCLQIHVLLRNSVHVHFKSSALDEDFRRLTAIIDFNFYVYWIKTNCLCRDLISLRISFFLTWLFEVLELVKFAQTLLKTVFGRICCTTQKTIIKSYQLFFSGYLCSFYRHCRGSNHQSRVAARLVKLFYVFFFVSSFPLSPVKQLTSPVLLVQTKWQKSQVGYLRCIAFCGSPWNGWHWPRPRWSSVVECGKNWKATLRGAHSSRHEFLKNTYVLMKHTLSCFTVILKKYFLSHACVFDDRYVIKSKDCTV